MLTSLVLAAAMAAPGPVRITLADRELRIPAPQGFADARAVADSARYAWDQQGALAALFLPQADIQALETGGAAVTSGDFFAIQVLSGATEAPYTAAEFAQLKRRHRAEWQEHLEESGMEDGDAAHRIRHSMLMLMHAEVDEQVTEVVPLPVLLENDHVITTGRVIVQRGPGDRPGELAVEVSSLSLVFVRERVFVATADTPYHTHADVEVLATRLKAWVDGIVAANPPGFLDRFELDRFDGRYYWVAGLLLLLVLSAVAVRTRHLW